MKQRTRRALLFWIILACLGILAIVLSMLLALPGWIGWLSSSLLWGATLAWVIVHFALSPGAKKRRTESFAGNRAIYDRIMREGTDAVSRYLASVKRRGVLPKSALYERPWFLVCGPAGAGKSLLVRGSGLDFPVRYPNEKDGLLIDGSQVSWYFGNDGVWIDVPGALMTDRGRDEWQATIAALSRLRPNRPVDGIALVVAAPDLLAAQGRDLKERAKALRDRLDELIVSWGIELQVSLIVTRMDEVPGFNEFFRAMPGASAQQVFGATLADDQQKMLPGLAFRQEFRLLTASLGQARLAMLGSERDPARKRLICRFAIHFDGLEEKLTGFVTELFKPSNYEGKPALSGFYFTSCKKSTAESAREPAADTNVSQTIVNHPLNPHRVQAPRTPAPPGAPAESVSGVFTAAVFREILAGAAKGAQYTQKRTRRQTIQYAAAACAIVIAACCAAGYLIASSARANALLDRVVADLSFRGEAGGSSTDALYRLGKAGAVVRQLQAYHDRGVPVSMRGGLYRGEKVLAALKPRYCDAVNHLIVKQAARYLEYKINGFCDALGELSGDDHAGLYRVLKAYLSMSESVGHDYQKIDTVFLRPVLTEATTNAILGASGFSRLPADLEIIVQDNIGLYLAYLKRGEFPRIQENQQLTGSARQRLQRLPDARSLYEAVAGRLSQDAPSISLDNLLGNPQESLLKSDVSISAIYTPDGYDRYVRDAISEASKNPYNLDWVMGASSRDALASLPEPKQLLAEMKEAYFDDYRGKWLDLLGSVRMEPFGDLSRCGRLLKKLTSDQSDLLLLLKAVGQYTVVKETDGLSDAGGKALGLASRFKATQQIAQKVSQKAAAAESLATQLPLQRQSGAGRLASTFDPLRSFCNSSSGGLGGFEGYRDKLLTLASRFDDIEQKGEDQAVVVFNAGADDPLLSAWKYTKNVLDGMPDDLAHVCENVLFLPINHAGSSVSAVLTQRLNNRWQDEVVKPFTSRFAGKYPFRKTSAEAAFNDVMDFFRPSTGTFWGFYDRVLSSYIVKSGSAWSAPNVGSVELNFNPQIMGTLKNAERIRDVFFKPDGTPRSFSMTIAAAGQNKYPATLEVCGQTAELSSGGQSAQIRWPLQATAQGASLKIHVEEGFTEDLSYPGEWGLLRLMQSGLINNLNNSAFGVKWSVNVQNMYVAFVSCKVQVSGSDHPFGDAAFTDFDCPTDLTQQKKIEPPAATASREKSQ